MSKAVEGRRLVAHGWLELELEQVPNLRVVIILTNLSVFPCFLQWQWHSLARVTPAKEV